MASQGPNSATAQASDATIGADSWDFGGGDIFSSDNLRVTVGLSASEISQYLKATDFNFSIPAGATIDGIVAEVECNTTDAHDYSVKIVKGGTISGDEKAIGTTIPVEETYLSYGGASDKWGVTWTADDINADNFGVVFSAQGNTGPYTMRVDHVRMTVYYTTVTLDTALPDADITTTGWSTAPLFSKINDASDATVITATAS